MLPVSDGCITAERLLSFTPLAELPQARQRMREALRRLNRRIVALESSGAPWEPGGLDTASLKLLRGTMLELLAEVDEQVSDADLALRRN